MHLGKHGDIGRARNSTPIERRHGLIATDDILACIGRRSCRTGSRLSRRLLRAVQLFERDLIHVLRARGVAAKRGITAEHGVDLRPSLGLVERIDRTRNDRDAIWSGGPSTPMTVRARTSARDMRGGSRTGIGKRGLESSGFDLFFGETLRAGIHKVAGYGEQADSSERAGDKRQDIGANRLVDPIERQSRGICGQRQRHAQPR